MRYPLKMLKLSMTYCKLDFKSFTGKFWGFSYNFYKGFNAECIFCVTSAKIEGFLQTEDDEMVLPKCTAFIRRLVYKLAEQKLSGKVSLQTRELPNKDRVLVVTKAKSHSEILAEEEVKCKDEMLEYENMIGFSKVIQVIVDSGKLVIGHNMLLDFLYMIDKFLVPLPNEYEEFKLCANSLFPK